MSKSIAVSFLLRRQRVLSAAIFLMCRISGIGFHYHISWVYLVGFFWDFKGFLLYNQFLNLCEWKIKSPCVTNVSGDFYKVQLLNYQHMLNKVTRFHDKFYFLSKFIFHVLVSKKIYFSVFYINISCIDLYTWILIFSITIKCQERCSIIQNKQQIIQNKIKYKNKLCHFR